ncbi:hypothetical protein Poli38472_000662 [Pythium oligandrum]|uniref:Peptidase C1A papain C-terminal domain-containing protein n=1 Tax=Pythium oligandrum TaxID=41045 RepID=A0A8K1CD54_PYTOL|nr:hypothetical protein Poli38472_000662 [Pythium oligandrum]|eukprot:TMW60620.1 hypothetical protein Poli38472_000662 [Pythium oligandrum]
MAHSFGTLVKCLAATGETPARCLWAAEDGELVDGRTLREMMVSKHVGANQSPVQVKTAHRNLEQHMNYIEDVQAYAQSLGHSFSYQMGVNERHLYESSERLILPHSLVHREIKAGATNRGRRLQSSSSSSSTATTLNWCSTTNPKGRSVCATVKSQAKCGSCWAFAASDAIETAVAIAANQTQAVALSPQQFLTCSTREMEQSFTYCWAKDRDNGAAWLTETITWKSSNNGCDGGMTHGAFQDAAQLNFGLLPEIVMPYTDVDGSASSSDSCVRSSNQSVASITGWTQVVGTDCTTSNDPNVLLKKALQSQPIAVAINSADPFKDYKSGFYSCPNSGVLSSKDDVNHALLLVGYGTDPSEGDYWILKNSYGSSWGEAGFMRLLADNKANCGLNIFPVIPVGASASASSGISVDGGGDEVFVGLSASTWIIIAVVVGAVTLIATVIGVFIARKRRNTMRQMAMGGTSYHLQPMTPIT